MAGSSACSSDTEGGSAHVLGLGSCVDSLCAQKCKEWARSWVHGEEASRSWGIRQPGRLSVSLHGPLLPPPGSALAPVLPISLVTRTDPRKSTPLTQLPSPANTWS